ncbi:MAG: YkoF family thiamine/hydroxymethylpyrimidine-binding protein [Gammaproteobacteria bacterium]
MAVDISLYPFVDDFIPPIEDMIERLSSYKSLEVKTSLMSTQIRGEYIEVMAALNREVKSSFESADKVVFAIRNLNNPLGD